MPDFPPAAVVTPIKYVNQEIYSGAAPTGETLTDLDLSAWVGKRRVLVYIKIYNNGTNPTGYVFLGKDEIQVPYGYGVSSLWVLVAGYICHLWIMTDDDGIIKWSAGSAQQTVLTLKAYT